ncbi:MAG: GNAT family N-acetyltransferase [bacterium]
MQTFSDFLSKQNVWSVDWEGATISVLDNPRLILTDSVNAEVVDRLIVDLKKITAESFGADLDNDTDDGVRNHVVDAGSIAFLHDHGQILGFASSKVFPEEGVFYLHGIATAQNYKCRGVGRKLAHTLSSKANLRMIAFTTQNPIMFCLLEGLRTKVYPNPKNPEVPMDLRKLGTKLTFGRSGNIDLNSFVVTGLYEKCLYDKIPCSRIKTVNQWFETALSVEDGSTHNGFLFIGEN